MAKQLYTATTDIRSQDYSGVIVHNERLTKNHSNKDINTNKSYLNNGETLLDYDELKEEHYSEHVKKVNKNRRGAKGKANSKYENVDDYLKRTKGNADTSFVQWFGNKEDWEVVKDELMKQGLTESEITNSLDEGYSTYAEGFNNRNEYIKMQQWVSHHDEATPHYHGRMFTKGETATGKPSKTFNSALALEFPDLKGNQDRMRAWRNREDTAFFDSLYNSLLSTAKKKGVSLELEFYRKDEHNGLTMSGYKSKKVIKELENETRNELTKEAKRLDLRDEQQNEREFKLTNKETTLKDKETEMLNYEDQLNEREKELNEREDSMRDALAEQARRALQEERKKDKEKYNKSLKVLKKKNNYLNRMVKVVEEQYKNLFNQRMEAIDIIEEQPLNRSVKNKIQNIFADDTEKTQKEQRKYKSKVEAQREPQENNQEDELEL